MACSQGRDVVTEAGRSPRDVGRPLHEVAHPPGGAEGVSAPELSWRLYQLSIGLFYWFSEPLLNLGLICLCLAFIAAQILRAERLDPTDERAVAEFALSAIQRHGYGEGQAVPSPRVSPEEQVMKTCCLCVNYVCIWLMFWCFCSQGLWPHWSGCGLRGRLITTCPISRQVGAVVPPGLTPWPSPHGPPQTRQLVSQNQNLLFSFYLQNQIILRL